MTLSEGTPMKILLDTLPQEGRVVWIGVRPERMAPLQSLEQVEAIAGSGLAGDHSISRKGSKRQVTLIQGEHMDAIASVLKMQDLTPGLLRRNIVIRGINLLALKDKVFHVGNTLLEYTGECHPCSRMEDNLGAGGYNAVRGHGGITARILEGGTIRKNDVLKMVSLNPLTK